MGTFYEAIRSRLTNGEERLRVYEGKCSHIANEVITALRNQLGFPVQVFKLVPTSEIVDLSKDVRRGPVGWIDNDGKYRFMLMVDLGRSQLTFRWSIVRESDGHWLLNYGGDQADPVRLNVDSPGSVVAALANYLMPKIDGAVAEEVHEKVTVGLG